VRFVHTATVAASVEGWHGSPGSGAESGALTLQTVTT
jgi:hypothetical protein